MDIFSKYLSCKVEDITSSLSSSIMLWKAKLSSPLKNNPKQNLPANNNKDDDLQFQVGLKTLVHPAQVHPHILHRYALAATPKPSMPLPSLSSLMSSSSSAFRASVMDDLIGTESGDYMSSDVAVHQDLKAEPPFVTQNKRSRARERGARTRQFPPPITLLRQQGYVRGRMPWVFKREYSDGRLIIRAERVKRHEYIASHRENGRLTMRLVRAEDDDVVYCDECGYPISEEEEEEELEEEVEELEDLEFNEEPEELGAEEECEEEDSVECEEEVASEGCNLSQKLSLGKENVRCGDLRECVTYGGELVHDSDPFWKGDGIGGASGYLGRPGSAPLRPMATVM